MRNCELLHHTVDHLGKCLSSSEYYLTGLSLKYCFLTIENIMLLAHGLRFNKSLIKLDLSHNGLKHFTVKFILDALLDNVSLSQLNLSGNYLDDNFAIGLAHILNSNHVLYKVDISKNPIGPSGA